MEVSEDKLVPQLPSTTGDLKTFLRTWGELNLDDRMRIVDQALVLLEENYVHLPLKRAMHAVDPLQRLRLLRHRLDESVEGELRPEIEFHNELTGIFNSLRDLHTAYRLPAPFKYKTAWLPFLVEEFWESGQRRYMVSKIVAEAGPETFQPGVEITHWNGTPIDQVVGQNAQRQAGSNEEARHARGLNSLTIRPLARGLPPEEEWVTLCYLDEEGQVHEWRQEWLVFEPGRHPNAVRPDDLLKEASALGLDDHTDDIQQVKKLLFAPPVALSEERARARNKKTAIRSARGGVRTFMPGVFQAKQVAGSGTKYGYIRIFTFHVRDADEFVDEFVRLAENLPDTGLIIDVRGNGGGLIYAAEQLLQVLTPRHVEPERAQFINTPLNLQICRNHRASTRFPGLDLGAWISSISQSVETGATYSLGYPITHPEWCARIGQRYFGPSVLIVDPLCYSATDIFAAGFQDHAIGPTLGVGGNTGAGGANVWSHGLLRQLMVPDQTSDLASPYLPLPRGADLRVAIRRTVRVGNKAGDVVEDVGITPDRVYRMSRRDVSESNQDLIAEAVGLLKGKNPHTTQISVERRRSAGPIVKIRTRNVTRVDATVGGRQVESLYPRRGLTRIDLQEVLDEVSSDGVEIEIRGYEEEELVVRRRLDVALK